MQAEIAEIRRLVETPTASLADALSRALPIARRYQLEEWQTYLRLNLQGMEIGAEGAATECSEKALPPLGPRTREWAWEPGLAFARERGGLGGEGKINVLPIAALEHLRAEIASLPTATTDRSMVEVRHEINTIVLRVRNQIRTFVAEVESLAHEGAQSLVNPDATPATLRPTRSLDPKRVFVVHGRDLPLARSLFDFLRALGLDPIEWGEAMSMTGEATPYVGSVLEAGFERAKAVVVLLTPDEEVRIRAGLLGAAEGPEQGFQSRPNVIFESGRAFATHPESTILVSVGDLRPFSDVVGRHVLRLDNSAEIRNELASRLETAGCPVRRGSHYLRAGDFVAPLCTPEVLAGDSSARAPDDRDLAMLENFRSGRLAAPELAERLHISPERAVFEIESLLETGLIASETSFKWGLVFGLSKSGRRKLVDKGRL